jgi:hypothetical protein
MISTSVTDCYLTNAGVWTDTASVRAGKEQITDADPGFIESILASIRPRTWKYREDFHGDDHGRIRVGIVAEELPEQFRVPGQGEGGMSAGLSSSFALAALRVLYDEVLTLRQKVALLS